MNNFTTNTYELKREICNFSEKIANVLWKHNMVLLKVEVA